MNRERPSNTKVLTVNPPDNRSILYLSEKRGYSGDLSYDWSNAS